MCILCPRSCSLCNRSDTHCQSAFVGKEGRSGPRPWGSRRLPVWTDFANPGRASFLSQNVSHQLCSLKPFFIHSLELRFRSAETPGKVTFLGAGFHQAGKGHLQRAFRDTAPSPLAIDHSEGRSGFLYYHPKGNMDPE